MSPILSRRLVLLLSVLSITSGSVHAAGDPAAGKSKSTVCAACHGPTGMSVNAAWPHLAGQKDGYLVKQLKAFRDGTRKNAQMSPMAKPLSDADIEDLAAYFSSQKHEAGPTAASSRKS